MQVETFPVGVLGCNCSILADAGSQHALVIDPGGDGERIHRRIEALGLTVDAILYTHAHHDHVGAGAELQDRLRVAVRLHPADRVVHDLLPVQAAMFGLSPPRPAKIEATLEDGVAIELGALVVRVLHVPGHSPGSVAFYVRGEDEARVFAGDTLFRGGVGRTDLWGGDGPTLIRAIREKLLSLPDSTLVVPGHGGSTTVGEERANNPFLSDGQRFW